WYLQYWVNSVKAIDYAIGSVEEVEGEVEVTLQRKGLMPMPIDVYVNTKKGSVQVYNIPLVIMRNVKASDGGKQLLHQDPWPWVNPEYVLTLDEDIRLEDIEKIEIDASQRMVDVNPESNTWTPQSLEP